MGTPNPLRDRKHVGYQRGEGKTPVSRARFVQNAAELAKVIKVSG